MFKDTKEGTTHHDKDSCYKCSECKGHYKKVGEWIWCNCVLGGDFKGDRDNLDITNE